MAAAAIDHRPLFPPPRARIAELFEPLRRPRGLAANLCGLRNKHSFQKETSLPAVFRTRLNAAADERPAKFKFFRLDLPRYFGLPA